MLINMARRLSKEKIERIINYGNKGVLRKDIAVVEGVSYHTVVSYIKGKKKIQSSERKEYLSHITIKKKEYELREIYKDWFDLLKNELPLTGYNFNYVKCSKETLAVLLKDEEDILDDKFIIGVLSQTLEKCLERIFEENKSLLNISLKNFEFRYDGNIFIITPDNYESMAFLFGFYKPILERELK